MRMRSLSAVVCTALLCTVLLGGILHDVIPHAHGENEYGTESAVWGSLHGALRHEEHASTSLPSGAFAIITPIITLGVVAIRARRYALTAFPHDPVNGTALRRGIELYRRFA
ncbi:hypothetical protein COU20_00065 [Candidatus Kaiserbacteria bacterium CG10_big_fil_rev_8_21_14_0_10_59_10]|uniref:Uncharacterized protein n=1 Tax=Candidatus Kaiserbacteria bacterium CG10_big_fil_rev_8_21_14_0_10_59_10 TaxID=1974612 RepID=A0A2H0U8W9_9BACT|nr:MAG: hypothetical protein COU20_00065 [Candidatus Kaiserbacteria bacterium CG10_big_fil_rev_8_21_14_0_10_59_10]